MFLFKLLTWVDTQFARDTFFCTYHKQATHIHDTVVLETHHIHQITVIYNTPQYTVSSLSAMYLPSNRLELASGHIFSLEPNQVSRWFLFRNVDIVYHIQYIVASIVDLPRTPSAPGTVLPKECVVGLSTTTWNRYSPTDERERQS